MGLASVLVLLLILHFVFDVFPLNSDTTQRGMSESPFWGEKCRAGRFGLYLNDSGNFDRLISAHFDRLLLQT